jgi:transcription initiation factor IIF auxiliary subunit
VKKPIFAIKFNNIARYVGMRNGQDWYEWMVYVDESEEVLHEIDAVEYLLHRSFPNPLSRKTDPNTNFSLESSGWGSFHIRITIFLKNATRLETFYYLDLMKPWTPDLFQKA